MFKFVWDERKRLVNLDKHGLDFDDVVEFDWLGARIVNARPDSEGRKRLKALGRYSDGTAVVIFALLGTEAVSIISFRHANAKERKMLNDQA